MYIETIDGLINALGGEWAAADTVDTSVDEVRVWLSRKAIPPGYHYRLDLAARKRGADVDPSVFGLSNDLERRQWQSEQTLKTANGRHA